MVVLTWAQWMYNYFLKTLRYLVGYQSNSNRSFSHDNGQCLISVSSVMAYINISKVEIQNHWYGYWFCFSVASSKFSIAQPVTLLWWSFSINIPLLVKETDHQDTSAKLNIVGANNQGTCCIFLFRTIWSNQSIPNQGVVD
jgi:hypothetical protein